MDSGNITVYTDEGDPPCDDPGDTTVYNETCQMDWDSGAIYAPEFTGNLLCDVGCSGTTWTLTVNGNDACMGYAIYKMDNTADTPVGTYTYDSGYGFVSYPSTLDIYE